MPSDAWIIGPIRPYTKRTHTYKYTSDLFGSGLMMLHDASDAGHSVEFLSAGMHAEAHGEWHIDDEERLVISFNCRTGAVRRSDGKAWVLHPTICWRSGDSDWVGGDDKGSEITMEHRRSILYTKKPGQKADSYIIDAL